MNSKAENMFEIVMFDLMFLVFYVGCIWSRLEMYSNVLRFLVMMSHTMMKCKYVKVILTLKTRLP